MANRIVTVTMKAVDSFSSTFNTYTAKLGQAASANRQMQQSSMTLEQSVNRLQQAFSLGIAGAMLNQVVNVAEDMNELGTQVHAARLMFGELTDEIGGSNMVLRNLREETGGFVNDLTLMSGASQLLRLNIVDNNRDLGELYGQIQRLKQPTDSTSDAIQNFALMLSNESLLRLDSFGISSANVKRRMDELGETFREATMAEMAAQVERLGDAAHGTETEIAKMQATLDNFLNNAAERAATGFNASAGLINATGQRLAYEARLNALVGEAQFAQGKLTLFGQPIEISPDERIAAEAALVFQDRLREGWVDAHDALTEYIVENNRMFSTSEAAIEAAASRLAQFNELLGFSSGGFMTPELLFNTGNLETMLGGLQLDSFNAGFAGGVKLFTPEEAAQAQRIADHMAHLVDQLDLLEGTDLVPEATVNRVKALAEETGAFAEQAQKGADAFRNLTLAQTTGTDNPDVLASELSGMFMEAAQSADVATDALERYQTALDLATGNETAFTLALQERIDKLASSGAAPDQIAEQLHELATYMRGATEMGAADSLLTVGNLDFMLGMQEGKHGEMIFDPSFNPVQALADAAAEMDGSLSASEQTLADAALSADAISVALSGGVESVDLIAEGLGKALNGAYQMKLDVIAPEWVKQMLTGGMDAFAAQMAAATRANGGTPPGQQAAGRSTRVVER